MTRLTAEWLKGMEEGLIAYDRKLTALIGMDLSSLACRGAGIPHITKEDMKRHKAAVVRVTAGKGVIGSFAESVLAVLRHMGADAAIPECCDVAGMHEAVSGGTEILFMADDDRFVAINVKTGMVAENDYATACGYVAALSAMAGGLAGKEVLLLGYGRVGKRALKCLLAEGAKVSLFDRDRGKTATMQGNRVTLLEQLQLPLSGLILDATSEGGYLGEGDISAGTLISAPGVPLSLNKEAFQLHHSRLMHDPLQTGVAVMLALAVKD